VKSTSVRTPRSLSGDAKEALATLLLLEAELEARIAEAPELPEMSAGGDDVHLVAEALVTDNAQKAFYVRQLEDVRTAIAAIATGGYGICRICGGSIPAARLAIVPDATQCVPCAASRR
jgi:RNA polymerase-binding transcription factor DksA